MITINKENLTGRKNDLNDTLNLFTDDKVYRDNYVDIIGYNKLTSAHANAIGSRKVIVDGINKEIGSIDKVISVMSDSDQNAITDETF